MSGDYYIGPDGSIHRRSTTNSRNNQNRTTTATRGIPAQRSLEHASSIEAEPYYPTRGVSTGRKVLFWIISMIISITIGVYSYDFGAGLFFGNEKSFFTAIGPVVVFIGAVAGSILYGIFFAKKADFSLRAYFLSALAALAGIIAATFATYILYWAVVVCFYLLIIGFIVAIVASIISGG